MRICRRAWTGFSRCSASRVSPPIPPIATGAARRGMDGRRAHRDRLRGGRAATAGHPIVVAHHDGPGPRVLFYGHYDVQPVDPLDLWEKPPFEPRLVEAPGGRSGSRRAAQRRQGPADDLRRGAAGVEGRTGVAALRRDLLLEGEEELGSANLKPFLRPTPRARADVALVCDTDMWNAKTPGDHGVPARAGGGGGDGGSGRPRPSLRPVRRRGPQPDPRSRRNPRGPARQGRPRDAARLLRRVGELPAEVRSQREGLGFDAAHFLGEVGLSVPAGERGRSVLEKIWSRPTSEVNGISRRLHRPRLQDGDPGKGGAKVSFRLVGDQDPLKIREAFRAFVERGCHRTAQWSSRPTPATAPHACRSTRRG